ncbi:hypothetical protein [Nocardioides bizhenqiangii]|uniref:ATP synthase protein I n=1 Tax=Nocardioides bizhenqiangii TaxID=3095076 RepID=A0ABZ0ZLK9_9ACTN|nr:MULTISPECIES: hypothetical protein [unclassified Nocardioides]MDZ5620830.1 hypothetical protein [Nocardioides sp. HM23]WQQ25194.1 hypothetical protein SHK19_14610 [Nocardioides sp. HM61]
MSTTTTSGPLALAVAVTVTVGVLVVLVAALTDGRSAAYGALVGAGIAVVVFAFGAFTVDAVARLMPAASLMVALLTYTLQVLLMLVVFVGLTRSGVLDDGLDRTWLGGAIIAGALAWTLAQLTASARARIPAYETTDEEPFHRPSEGVGPAGEGGAR